jgi:broad specificity phosphatase PhoE
VGITDAMNPFCPSLQAVLSSEVSSKKKAHPPAFETYTLYLIRHGEASHNVLEKREQKSAWEQAIREGVSPDSLEIKHRMEQARMDVLCDVSLLDANLSDEGRREARAAAQTLRNLQSQHPLLTPPTRVLVSPLTRTLETANLLFPEHNNIHVRAELRERCTGKPPDTRLSSATLRSRKSFKRFSMDRLRADSLMSKLDLDAILSISPNAPFTPNLRTSSIGSESDSATEEDKATLRQRTTKLFELLTESQDQSIAVVTHKGYLRELERGTFGKPLAREFDNCEIRVYQVRIATKDHTLDHAERIA